ncbi:hypothetical protein HDA40_004172 [Hamadaea flava]|uniref:Uncharacterized protein n=1 Tax=Hamadaea flava TaxID=1742688 RepID=A0ABV8LIP3_9ACTN|nr:hypothetical protein [Hamadaea flava]MCP2325665.1 hypothetical protein [Hamadaea flava]
MSIPWIGAAATVVVVGDFKPTRIHPKWLYEAGLISQADALGSVVQAAVPGEVSVFRTDWFQCDVQSDRLTVVVADPADFERLRDLVAGLLRSLTELQCQQMGINRVVHLQMGDAGQYNRVGDQLANNEIWAGTLLLPGMRNLTTWGVRPDLYGGRIQVQVEPSQKVKNGVYVAVNDHFDLTAVERQPTSRDEVPIRSDPEEDDRTANAAKTQRAITILMEEWTESMRRADEIIDHVGAMGKV